MRRTVRLQRILEAGGWTVHDLINRVEIRSAVRAQWRLSHLMERDRAIEAYIEWLEFLDASSQGDAP